MKGIMEYAPKEELVTEPIKATNKQWINYCESPLERYMVITLIYIGNRSNYGEIIYDVENGFKKATNRYPKTVKDTHNLMSNLKHNPQNIL